MTIGYDVDEWTHAGAPRRPPRRESNTVPSQCSHKMPRRPMGNHGRTTIMPPSAATIALINRVPPTLH